MTRAFCHQCPVAAFRVACPDLVARRTGKMVGYASAIGAEIKSVRHAFAGAGELFRIRTVKIDAERLRDFIAYDLDKETLVIE